MLQFVLKPFGFSASLRKGACTLKEILARIPGLQTLYQRTFSEEAACLAVNFHHTHGSVQLRIDDTHLFQSRDDLRQRIQVLRNSYPWLNAWCLTEATHAWDRSMLIFHNLEKPSLGEFSDQALVASNNGLAAPLPTQRFIQFETIIPPLAGGLTVTHPTTIQPINGTLLCEFSLYFCGAFLLSSLVRYRPQLWQHALSHTALEYRAADDRALSLVESFLQTVLSGFPSIVEHVIDL